MNSELRSILLIGTAYSGSTILGMSLNSSKNGTTYVGELSRVPGLLNQYHLDLEPGTCSACQIDNISCKIFTDNVLKQLGQKSPTQAHRYLSRRLQCKTIVDASKHPEWLRLLADETPARQIRVLVTVKNPKNYVQSCLDRNTDAAWQAANAWRDTYVDTLRTLHRLHIAYFVVRNEDFMQNKEDVIANVWNFLGYRNTHRNNSKIIHAIGGNPAARTDELGNKKIIESAKRFSQRVFDLNPNKKSPTATQNITFDTQVLFDTPGLSDIANILGYSANDLI